jgi:lysophospholipase L1-like esterase
MIWYNILCVGDSQTFGARTYGCYPMYLAKLMREKWQIEYRTINRSVNGYTARDLWFKVNEEIDSITDTTIACIMIGTNDVRKQTTLYLFKEYVRQILLAFKIKGYMQIYVGSIPPIVDNGVDPYYPNESVKNRYVYQDVLHAVVEEMNCTLVEFTDMRSDDYIDSVHFSESGNKKVANAFAQSMERRFTGR